MATRNDDEFAPLDRLLDGSVEHAGEAGWIRARALELVRSMEPLQVPSGRKQRLLLSLGQGWVRRRLVWLRPVTIGALLIGGGAIASAALTDWPARAVRSFHSGFSARRPVARDVARNDAPVAPSISPPIAPRAPRPQAVARRLSAEVHSRRPLLAPAARDLSALDDPSPVIEATRALRMQRNPGRARALAGRYLERQPAGALAEEALAISIEAAVEAHDPDAAALAAQYLARFPRGSFRSLAERTLAQPGGSGG